MKISTRENLYEYGRSVDTRLNGRDCVQISVYSRFLTYSWSPRISAKMHALTSVRYDVLNEYCLFSYAFVRLVRRKSDVSRFNHRSILSTDSGQLSANRNRVFYSTEILMHHIGYITMCRGLHTEST